MLCYFQCQTDRMTAVSSCDISISIIGGKSQDTSQPLSTLSADHAASSVLPAKDESVLWADLLADIVPPNWFCCLRIVAQPEQCFDSSVGPKEA